MCITASTIYAKIAKRDIITYKVVRHTYRKKGVRMFRPIIYGILTYTLGLTYDETCFNEVLPCKVSSHGFYSWSDYKMATGELEGWRKYYPGEGYTVIKCVIPKGARYFKSEGGCTYCSDKIRIVAYQKHGEWIDASML